MLLSFGEGSAEGNEGSWHPAITSVVLTEPPGLETIGCMWALLILPRLVACPLSPCMCECGSDLQVHTNAITGTIPTWLSALTQLEYVHHSSCVVSEPARCVLVSIVMCKLGV
jgi:hypothetical protein